MLKALEESIVGLRTAVHERKMLDQVSCLTKMFLTVCGLIEKAGCGERFHSCLGELHKSERSKCLYDRTLAVREAKKVRKRTGKTISVFHLPRADCGQSAFWLLDQHHQIHHPQTYLPPKWSPLLSDSWQTTTAERVYTATGLASQAEPPDASERLLEALGTWLRDSL